MNRNFIFLLPLILCISGCEVVEGIFKAGMVWAFFLVFLVVVLIIWLLSKRKK